MHLLNDEEERRLALLMEMLVGDEPFIGYSTRLIVAAPALEAVIDRLVKAFVIPTTEDLPRAKGNKYVQKDWADPSSFMEMYAQDLMAVMTVARRIGTEVERGHLPPLSLISKVIDQRVDAHAEEIAARYQGHN